VQKYLAKLLTLLFLAHQQMIQSAPVEDNIILAYLNQADSYSYSVSTIANMKLQGALGHHVFIQHSSKQREI
jgi:hypothetical protein